MSDTERITSFEQVIIPWRAPEIGRFIKSFSGSTYFYNDESGTPATRFAVWDRFIESFEKWSGVLTNNFHSYPVAGSTEAINWCLYDLKSRGGRLVLLESEYKYYAYVAEKINLPFRTIRDKSEINVGDTFVVSAPFCRTGEVREQVEFLKYCDTNSIEVWIDAAYFGSTPKIELYIPKTTSNIFFSFSKQFGLALNRQGLWLRSSPIADRDLLMRYGYHSIGPLSLISALMDEFPNDWLHKSYSQWQKSLTQTPSGIVYMCMSGRCLTPSLMKLAADHK